MGGGYGECTAARPRHGLWGPRHIVLLALALALFLTNFRRHRPCILTVASIVALSRDTAANSLRDDVDGSQYPPTTGATTGAATRDSGRNGVEEKEKAARVRDTALEANTVQRYPPAHIELQKGIDLFVRIFYSDSYIRYLITESCRHRIFTAQRCF